MNKRAVEFPWVGPFFSCRRSNSTDASLAQGNHTIFFNPHVRSPLPLCWALADDLAQVNIEPEA